MTKIAKTVRSNIHGVPLNEIQKRPTDEDYARTPRLPIGKYPNLPLVQEPPFFTARVKGSRVSLDSLAGFYRIGHTVDYLADGFPTVEHSDIQVIIDFYLAEREIVDAYLDHGEELAEISREFWESNFGVPNFSRNMRADSPAAKSAT